MYEEAIRRAELLCSSMRRQILGKLRSIIPHDLHHAKIYFCAAFVVATAAAAVFAFNAISEDSETYAAVAATFAAVGASFLTIFFNAQQKEKDQSHFYVRSYLEGVEQAASMLEDGNNSRVRWIAAARILGRCKQLEALITQQEHKTLLEIRRDEFRHRFAHVLGVDNPRATAAFFYGVDNQLDLTEAAGESSRRDMGRDSRILALDESSIRTVWEFARFPTEYDDPIGGRFLAAEVEQLRHAFPALHQFLNHEDNFISLGGQVTPREQRYRRR